MHVCFLVFSRLESAVLVCGPFTLRLIILDLGLFCMAAVRNACHFQKNACYAQLLAAG